MAVPIEEVLSVWRELERTGDRLPENAPEREAILFEIVQMRRLYARLTERTETTDALLDGAHRQIAECRAAIRDAEHRLSR